LPPPLVSQLLSGGGGFVVEVVVVHPGGGGSIGTHSIDASDGYTKSTAPWYAPPQLQVDVYIGS
jgi:hypothetical protein